MSCIDASPDTIKSRFQVLEARANVDSLDLFCKKLRDDFKAQLRARHLRWKTVGKEGQFWGYRVICNQPTRSTLAWLADRQREFEGTPFELMVSRVDLGIDFETESQEQATEMLRELERCIRLKNVTERQARLSNDIGNSVYWNRGGRDKNLIAYDGKPSKAVLTNQPRCRLELKLRRQRSIRKNGLSDVASLVDVDPRAVFERNMFWYSFDLDEGTLDRVEKRNLRGRSKNDPWTERLLRPRIKNLISRFGLKDASGLALIPDHVVLPAHRGIIEIGKSGPCITGAPCQYRL